MSLTATATKWCLSPQIHWGSLLAGRGALACSVMVAQDEAGSGSVTAGRLHDCGGHRQKPPQPQEYGRVPNQKRTPQ